MQSDLDMSTNWLSKQIHDLELLLRSGVLRHSTAIVLSHPSANACKEDLCFFIKDLFTRLQIGGVEFKKKALDSLIQLLSEDEKSATLVAKEGEINYLISLLDMNVNSFIREQAVLAVSLLAANSDHSRKSVFEEGALGPLLRIMESSSMQLKEKAVMAVESITRDADNAWAILAYGGVPILIQLCKSGSLVAQSHAIGAVRNVSTNEDIRLALAEEGAIPVILQLLVSGTVSAQEKAANCVAILASSSEYIQSLLMQEKGLQGLLHCLHESSSYDTLEHILRAIYSLSKLDSAFRVLSSSTPFIVQLADLIKHGNIILQHLSASLLSHLSISEGNKKEISGCIGSLIKLMDSAKPDGLQEVASNALVSLLSIKCNRKELVKDEKCLTRLVQMLDPRNDLVAKSFPIAVVTTIMAGGSQGCRKRLVAAGAYGHLQSLVEMEVPGSKKALQRLSGNRLKIIFSRTWRD